jgi:DNA invertase Pin-like site-specific DNA recombinase
MRFRAGAPFADDPRVGEFRGHALAASVPDEPEALSDEERDIRRSPSRLGRGEPVIGYLTVSDGARRAEADGAAGAIEHACRSADWKLVEIVRDREASRCLERPGLTYALRLIADGKARALVVSDLKRLRCSIIALGALMTWFGEAQAAFVALDLRFDTSTPAGHELAAALITLGDWERGHIAERTRSGLADRASGRPAGRLVVSDRPALLERITAMRATMTLQAIADQLNAECVPTLRGGTMWRPSSVQAALGYRPPGPRSRRDQLPHLEDGDSF